MKVLQTVSHLKDTAQIVLLIVLILAIRRLFKDGVKEAVEKAIDGLRDFYRFLLYGFTQGPGEAFADNEMQTLPGATTNPDKSPYIGITDAQWDRAQRLCAGNGGVLNVVGGQFIGNPFCSCKNGKAYDLNTGRSI